MSKPTIVMSPPDYFAIEYSINPWMNVNNQVDKTLAQKQWHTLKATYEKLSCPVLAIPPQKGLPDLVFTTDHGVMLNDTFYLSNFRYKERKQETDIAAAWYATQGIKTQTLPKKYSIEGGDLVKQGENLFIGHGFRTSRETVHWFTKNTSMTVVPLGLTSDRFYHLDTCFFPLDTHTAFYYPRAFTKDSAETLKLKFHTLIPITLDEVNSFVCNSVVIEHHVVCQPNSVFEKRLRDLNYTPIPIDMSEFNKSGGGLHCLSQILS